MMSFQNVPSFHFKDLRGSAEIGPLAEETQVNVPWY